MQDEPTVGPRVTDAERAFLIQVMAGNVTWHAKSYRVWSSETEYELATEIGKRMKAWGHITQWDGAGRGMSGGVEITALGRQALSEEALA